MVLFQVDELSYCALIDAKYFTVFAIIYSKSTYRRLEKVAVSEYDTSELEVKIWGPSAKREEFGDDLASLPMDIKVSSLNPWIINKK